MPFAARGVNNRSVRVEPKASNMIDTPPAGLLEWGEMKLGLLLSTPPEHPNLEIVMGLGSAALETGHEVYLYLIDEGVKNLGCEEIGRLVTQGTRLLVCAYSCQRRGLPTSGPYGTYCGLVLLSDMIRGCDRFLPFN